MNHLRLLQRIFGISMALLVLAGCPRVEPPPPPPPPPLVQLTQIGNPIWRPVDFHLFSAPVGTSETGYAEYFETLTSLLPPPDHQPHPDLGIGPGEPHAPPYDGELAAGVAARGFRESREFRLSEFSDGNGVFLAWMNIPAPGEVGSSPDFASGAVIPNRLFPITVRDVLVHQGRQSVEEFTIPPLDESLNPPFDVDGHSHFPVFIAENTDFLPEEMTDPLGSYRYELTLLDQDGNGWTIVAEFTVSADD